MDQVKLQADLAIIGDGIASLALAYLAAQRDIRVAILGKNFKGTTYSATGLIAPRPDYILSDAELVQRTAFECLRWLRLFHPQILKPHRFLIPLVSELPYSLRSFRALLSQYDQITKSRSTGLGNHFLISQSALAKMEPNLRKDNINGAIVFGEWTVDPAVLLKKLGWENSVYTDLVRSFQIEDLGELKINNGLIEEVEATGTDGNRIKVSNDRGPLLVVNATGPWMKDACARLGVPINYQLRVGIQMEVPGQYFQSGIVTFGSDGKYLICLQKKDVLQVGPTNYNFSGHPDNFIPSDKEIGYLKTALCNILENKQLPSYSFFKHGFRVKPTIIDTNRPVIWSHNDAGLANLYSLHPGKMALALLAGDEMLDRAINDGWLARPKMVAGSRIHLDGNRKNFNEIKLLLLKVRSLVKFCLFYLKFLLKAP